MTYFTLPNNSELQRTLESICLAMESGRGSVMYAGDEIKARVSKKGTKFFTLSAGIPCSVSVFQSRTKSGHQTIIELGLSTLVEDSDGRVESKLRVRGQVKMIRGRPAVFFFDPESDGRRKGELSAKLEAMNKGVSPELLFTEADIERHRTAGDIDQTTASDIKERLCTRTS